MKPTEKQKKVITAVAKFIDTWEVTNDIDSDTHIGDIESFVDDLAVFELGVCSDFDIYVDLTMGIHDVIEAIRRIR